MGKKNEEQPQEETLQEKKARLLKELEEVENERNELELPESNKLRIDELETIVKEHHETLKNVITKVNSLINSRA